MCAAREAGHTESDLQVQQGPLTDAIDLDELVHGAGFVISVLGDRELQQDAKINTALSMKLIPGDAATRCTSLQIENQSRLLEITIRCVPIYRRGPTQV